MPEKDKSFLRILVSIIVGIATALIIGGIVFWKDVNADVNVLKRNDEYLFNQIEAVQRSYIQADTFIKEDQHEIEQRIEVIRKEQNERFDRQDAKLDKILEKISKL